MENRFNRIDGTAPIIDAAESKNIVVPKSVFDFSRSVAGPLEVGALYPIDCFDTVPGERIDVSFTGLVDVLSPTIQKLINGFDVYVHAYFNRESDLWEGSKNFTTKGRSGKITASIPRFDVHAGYFQSSGGSSTRIGEILFDTPGSLADWLGVQPDLGKVSGSTFTPFYNSTPRLSHLPWLDSSSPAQSGVVPGIHSYFVNAIPFFMYQRLWRDKYAPKNLLQGNKNLFPDNEDHFIIPYSSARFNVFDYTADSGVGEFSINFNQYFQIDSTDLNVLDVRAGGASSSIINNLPLYMDRLRFRQYKGDDFTTASPFPDLVRGDLPDLGDFINSSSNFKTELKASDNNNHSYTVAGLLTSGSASVAPITYMETPNAVGNRPMYVEAGFSYLYSKITTQSLVALNAYNIFVERMGRTNGDYDSMIKAQFGFDPNNQSREARYLGGLHFSLGNNEIIQQSESSASSNLGDSVVRSSGSGSGRIASFTSPDYGYFMLILSIVPNTWYSEGQDEYLSQRYQTDRYFPIFEKLGPEPIKNRALYISGNATTDEDVFGWAERGFRYKSRRNVVRGLFHAKENEILDFSARTTKRTFNSTPKLNNIFTTITPENFDHSIFAAPSEYPFYFAGNIGVKRIAPMSEYTAPAGFSPASM